MTGEWAIAVAQLMRAAPPGPTANQQRRALSYGMRRILAAMKDGVEYDAAGLRDVTGMSTGELKNRIKRLTDRKLVRVRIERGHFYYRKAKGESDG